MRTELERMCCTAWQRIWQLDDLRWIWHSMIATAQIWRVIEDDVGIGDGYPGSKICYPVASLITINQPTADPCSEWSTATTPSWHNPHHTCSASLLLSTPYCRSMLWTIDNNPYLWSSYPVEPPHIIAVLMGITTIGTFRILQIIPVWKCIIREWFVCPGNGLRWGASFSNARHSKGMLRDTFAKSSVSIDFLVIPRRTLLKLLIHFQYTDQKAMKQWRYIGCLRLKCTSRNNCRASR